jgi:secreted protein with Ig-like and vWFA domain
MNLQIIGIYGVLAVVGILLAVFRKQSRLVWILTTLFLVPAAFGMHAMASYVEKSEQVVDVENETHLAGQDKVMLQLAMKYLEDGDLERAEEVLNIYAETSEYNDTYLKAWAALEYAKGNEDGAKAICDMLDLSVKDLDDYDDLLEADAEDKKDKEEKDGEQDFIDDLAEAIAKNDVKDLEEIFEKMPEALDVPYVREEYLRGLLDKEDYDAVVEYARTNETAEELLMLSDLVRQGAIDEDVLEDSPYLENLQEEADTLKDWIQDQTSDMELTERDQEIVDQAMASLDYSEYDSLDAFQQNLKEDMARQAEKDEETESSKLYMELSRVFYEEDNETVSTEYLREALLTAGDSEDPAYAEPVRELNEILEDKENTEGLKQIDEVTQELVDNMGPRKLKVDAEAGDRNSRNKDADEDADWDEDVSEDTQDPGSTTSGLGIATEDAVTEEKDFAQHVTTQVNQMTASLNIASIDAKQFETVTSIISLDESIADTAEKFKENVRVYDCDIEIPDYKVEKLEDKGVNIILVCDNSGSMEGDKIANLKSAVGAFVNGLSSDVKVGIVSFDGGVLGNASASLGSNAGQLKAAIDNMGAFGGTNIYGGVSSALDQMQAGERMNVIILMSDGQDSAPDGDRLYELKKNCSDRDTVIYSMGLGADVDSAVLSTYSGTCGGKYTFVSNSATLQTTYNYLYQMSKNRYRITYTAADTLQTDRRLQVEWNKDSKIYDVKNYSLVDNSELEDSLGEKYDVVLDGITISGFDTRLLYKSTVDQTIYLRGKGLEEKLNIKVSIKSGVSYDLECEYEKDTSKYAKDTAWKVTVPAKVACGEYDVYVTVNGKRAVFKSGLIVTSGDLHVVRFGSYVFEASTIGQTSTATTMSGYVRMNDWLSFTGGVSLVGDVKTADSVVMKSSAFNVSFRPNDPDLNLFAKGMAKVGRTISVRPMTDFTLYRNDGRSPDDDAFKVQSAVLGQGLVIQDLLTLSTPGVELYPDRMEVNFNRFTTELPFQDKLLDVAGYESPFAFGQEHEEVLIVSQSAVDCKFELKLESSDKKNFSQAKLCNMPMYVNLDDMELKINTKDDEYEFKITTNIAMLCDGVGFSIKYKEGLDEIMLYADHKINTTICGVPITFSDFALGVTDMGGPSTWQEVFNATLQGQCDISMAKVSAFFPKLKKFTKDVSLLSLDDTKLNLRFKNPYIGVETTLKAFEAVELGSASIKLGMNMDYSNSLIGYDGVGINGIVGKLSKGFKLELANCLVDISGSEEVAISDKVIGSDTEGHGKYRFEWWFFSHEKEVSGEVFLGMYQQHNGKYCFGVVVRNGTSIVLNEAIQL